MFIFLFFLFLFFKYIYFFEFHLFKVGAEGTKISPEEVGDINILAGILKLFFRELPDPLLTFEKYDSWMALTGFFFFFFFFFENKEKKSWFY